MKVLLLLFTLALAPLALSATAPGTGHDWTRFGWDARRSNDDPHATGITGANVGSLARQQVHLPGTVDSSAIYLHGVSVHGATHDRPIQPCMSRRSGSRYSAHAMP